MYKYDTHVHTCEVSPCSKVKAAEAARLYSESEYSGIVITDHYYEGFFENLTSDEWEDKVDEFLKGYKTALKEGKSKGLNVLLGMEITFIDSPNDYLVFGIDEEFLKEYPELYRINLRKFRELIEGKDILIYQAHPFRPALTPAEPSLLDGLEIYNGNPRHDSRNHLAYSFARENKLRMISGSDFHQVEDLARGGIIIPEEIKTSGDLVKVLKESTNIENIGDTLLEMTL